MAISKPKIRKTWNQKRIQHWNKVKVRNEAKSKGLDAKIKRKKKQQQLRRQRRLDPNTPQGRRNILTDKKQQAKEAKIEAERKMAEQDPKIRMMEERNKLKLAEIAEKGSVETAKAGAIAGSVTKAAEAIVNENDSDDEKQRLADQVNLLTTANSGYVRSVNDDGLQGGVL